MTWWQNPLTVLAALASFLLLALLRSFLGLLWPALGQDIALYIYRSWVRAYTVFMCPAERKERLLDILAYIDDFVAEQQKFYSHGEVGVRLLVRLLGDIPSDLIEGLLAAGPASARFYRVNRPALTDRAIATIGTLIAGLCLLVALVRHETWVQAMAGVVGVAALLSTVVTLIDSNFSVFVSVLVTVVGLGDIIGGISGVLSVGGLVLALLGLGYLVVGGGFGGVVLGVDGDDGTSVVRLGDVYGGLLDGLVVFLGGFILIGLGVGLVAGSVGGLPVGIAGSVGGLLGVGRGVALSRRRLRVYDGFPAKWSYSKAILAMAPVVLPLVGLVWRHIGVWPMLTLETAVVVLWQVALFLAEKIYQRRSGPPSTPVIHG
jgi:hypothetical protein